MECIPCGDPPPPYEPHCKHLSFLLPLLTVGLTSVGRFVKCSHECRLFIPAHNRWCFKMKQQGYNSLKANISSYSTLLNSSPNATRTKTQAAVPQQSLHTHNMPAQGPWSNQNHSLERVERAIVHSLSLIEPSSYAICANKCLDLQAEQLKSWNRYH